MIGAQGSQFVLLVANICAGRLEGLLLSIATGQNSEADLLVAGQFGLDQPELLSE